MDKKILFVVYQSPIGSIWTNEVFRTAFGMYGEDIDPSILIMDEASVGLSENTKPEKLNLLPLNIVHRFIKKYETNVYGVKEHINKYHVDNIDSHYNVKILNEKDLNMLFHNFDIVIYM